MYILYTADFLHSHHSIPENFLSPMPSLLSYQMLEIYCIFGVSLVRKEGLLSWMFSSLKEHGNDISIKCWVLIQFWDQFHPYLKIVVRREVKRS